MRIVLLTLVFAASAALAAPGLTPGGYTAFKVELRLLRTALDWFGELGQRTAVTR